MNQKLSVVFLIFAILSFVSALPYIPESQEHVVDLIKKANLEQRESPAQITADLLAQVYTEIITKVTADLQVSICADVHAALDIELQGLISGDIGLTIPEIQADVDTQVSAVVKATVEADLNLYVFANINLNILNIIMGICPDGSSSCINSHAATIVSKVYVSLVVDVRKVFVDLKANLAAAISADVKVAIHNLQVNLILEQIVVNGYVNISAKIIADLQACLRVLIPDLNISADLVAQIHAALLGH